MVAAFAALWQRDLRLAWRRKTDLATVCAFLVWVCALFPLAVGPEPELLRRMAPGVIWVAVLLAHLLALGRLFVTDQADGSLDTLLLAPQPLVCSVAAKVSAHWCLVGLPLVLCSPLMALQFGLSPDTLWVLCAALLLGTPWLALMGAFGAALTLGSRSAGVLVCLLIGPLYLPALILGAGAVDAHVSGLSPLAHLQLLAALDLLAVVLCPWATAAALRVVSEPA